MGLSQESGFGPADSESQCLWSLSGWFWGMCPRAEREDSWSIRKCVEKFCAMHCAVGSPWLPCSVFIRSYMYIHHTDFCTWGNSSSEKWSDLPESTPHMKAELGVQLSPFLVTLSSNGVRIVDDKYLPESHTLWTFLTCVGDWDRCSQQFSLILGWAVKGWVFSRMLWVFYLIVPMKGQVDLPCEPHLRLWIVFVMIPFETSNGTSTDFCRGVLSKACLQLGGF